MEIERKLWTERMKLCGDTFEFLEQELKRAKRNKVQCSALMKRLEVEQQLFQDLTEEGIALGHIEAETA